MLIYPTSAELASELALQGFSIPAGFNSGTLIQSAIDGWCERTGWHPFLNSTSALSTRKYTPGGARTLLTTIQGGYTVLALRGGLLGTPTSVVVNDKVLTFGTDYWLDSGQFDDDYFPNGRFTTMRFLISTLGKPQSIVITAPFGYCVALPARAFNGILALASAEYADRMMQVGATGQTIGNILEEQLGDASRKYGESPLLGFRKAMHQQAALAINIYKRTAVGVL